MNIFKSKMLTWWQVGILKLSLLSLGIAIGSLWYEIFAPYIPILIILGILLGIYLSFVWLKK